MEGYDLEALIKLVSEDTFLRGFGNNYCFLFKSVKLAIAEKINVKLGTLSTNQSV